MAPGNKKRPTPPPSPTPTSYLNSNYIEAQAAQAIPLLALFPMLHADAAFKQQATTNHSLNATPTPSHIFPH
jgi:hypothetical protein